MRKAFVTFGKTSFNRCALIYFNTSSGDVPSGMAKVKVFSSVNKLSSSISLSISVIDIRLRLWSNKQLLIDRHQWTTVDLSPLVAEASEDQGKPLWVFISRISNMREILELGTATSVEDKEEEERNWTELSEANKKSEKNESIGQNATKRNKKYESGLVSKIVAVEFFNQSSFGLHIPMTVAFALEKEPVGNARFMCVFLITENNTVFGTWNPNGCSLASLNKTHAVCRCYHFTNFAVLMDIYETQRSFSAKHQVTLSYISYVGSFLSILSCAALIVLYYILRLKGDRVAIHKQFAISIIVVQTLFLIMANTSEDNKLHHQFLPSGFPQKACMAVAVLLHYSVTVMFIWMLIEGVHLYVTLVYVFCTKTFFWKYFLVSWGVPILMVGVALGVFKENYRAENLCWIHTTVLRLFLVPTLSIVVVINVLILTRVIVIIIRSKSCLNLLDKSEQQLFWTGLKASAVLLPLLGLTWMFAFFTVSTEISEFLSHLFTYLFTVFNSFQGLLLFLFHCVLSSEVKAAFHNYMRKNFSRYDSEFSRSKSIKETTGSEFAPETVSPVEYAKPSEGQRETKDSSDAQPTKSTWV
ncbi:Adhesion G-protein coupled receptor D1 [Bulinus truncatus]|nr:Adhesion G-protein coupled receptor D1 [Bulinus truncatus]